MGISTVFVMMCYCFGMGVSSSGTVSASATGIPSKYFGTYKYAGEEHVLEKKFIFYITGATSSIFEGPYGGSGIVACSNLDPNELVFNVVSGVDNQENFTFKYRTWSRLVGDGFEKQPESIIIMGRMKRDASSARISSSEYVRAS